jgi:hypothetical protein
MRTFTTAVLLTVAGLVQAFDAAAQTPPPAPPAPPAAPAPAAPAPATPPPEAAPAPAAAPAAAAAPAPAATPAAPANWYDKFSADAFVDAYAAIDWNSPKPQGPFVLSAASPIAYRAFDAAQGFSVNWVGVNASYAADPIGATVGLRIGPGAAIYNGGVDDVAGLEYVKQAYATWKASSALTLDFGKWDQPYGSEVADSQLNMNYTRSVLFWEMQPLFFTGLRLNYAISDSFNLLLFAANGWNETIDNNRSKTFGTQITAKAGSVATFYLGYALGPEQADAVTGAMGAIANVPDANAHWRHLVDFVADIDPTAALRFLFNFDYRYEDVPNGPTHNEIAYGGNLVIKYAFTDAFNAALRGGYFHDEHGDVLGNFLPGLAATNVEDFTLSLNYAVGSHLAFMFDNRLDVSDQTVFAEATPGAFMKSQFTSTLGIIASTK